MSTSIANSSRRQEVFPFMLYDMEHASRRSQEQADRDRISAESDQSFPPLDFDVPVSSPPTSPLTSPTRVIQAQPTAAWYKQRHEMYKSREVWEAPGWQSAVRERRGGVLGPLGHRRLSVLTATGPNRMGAAKQPFAIHEDVDASLSDQLSGLDVIASTQREGGDAFRRLRRRRNRQHGRARHYQDRITGIYRPSGAYRPRYDARAPRAPRNSPEGVMTTSREDIRRRYQRIRDVRRARIATRRRQHEAGTLSAGNGIGAYDESVDDEDEVDDDADELA